MSDMSDQLDLESLDPGIRNLVAYLRANGFHTCDSGDGKTKEMDEWTLDIPHVFSQVDPERMVSEARRMVVVLREAGVDVCEQQEFAAPCVNASYDPVNNIAVIELTHVDDSMLCFPKGGQL